MIKVSLIDIRKVGQWTLPLGVIAAGLLVVVAVQAAPSHSKAALTTIVTTPSHKPVAESPLPVADATVSINGTAIPTNNQGSSDVAVPGGKAHVEVSGGHTQVTTDTNGTTGAATNSSAGNVNIQVNSTQTEGGSNWGTTQVHGFSNSADGSTMSSNSTSVFSTGTGNVSVHTQ
jgi:hypothetical protein